jgi:hypothetical protein
LSKSGWLTSSSSKDSIVYGRLRFLSSVPPLGCRQIYNRGFRCERPAQSRAVQSPPSISPAPDEFVQAQGLELE